MGFQQYAQQADRLDNAELATFQRELESIDQRLFEVQHPGLKGRQLVPSVPNIPDWARVYTWRMFESIGEAQIIANMGDDLPMADVAASEGHRVIQPFGKSYGWDIFEIRDMTTGRAPLDEQRARAVRRAIEQGIDRTIALGNERYGLEGILSLSSANTFTPVNKNGTSSPAWFDNGNLVATAEEMKRDLMKIASDRVAATDEVWDQYVIALPIEHYNAAAETPIGNNADRTVIQFVLQNSPYIEDIVPWNRCKGAGAGGDNRMACFPSDEEVVAAIVPMEFTPQPPQQRNLRWVVNAIATCGGVVARYPVAISYGDGI